MLLILTLFVKTIVTARQLSLTRILILITGHHSWQLQCSIAMACRHSVTGPGRPEPGLRLPVTRITGPPDTARALSALAAGPGTSDRRRARASGSESLTRRSDSESVSTVRLLTSSPTVTCHSVHQKFASATAALRRPRNAAKAPGRVPLGHHDSRQAREVAWRLVRDSGSKSL